MKKINLKFSFLSLLTILTIAIFITSCEKSDTTTESIQGISEVAESNENPIVFNLPDKFNNMTNQELAMALEGYTEEDIMELATIVNSNEIRSKHCITSYTYCRSSSACGEKRKRHLKQCDYGEYHWTWGSCCPY